MTDDLDGALWDVRLMQGHIAPREKRVGANIMEVEAEALKVELVCVKAQEGDNTGAGNTGAGN